MVSVLTSRPKVRAFKPGRRDGLFKGDNNFQNAFIQTGSKAGASAMELKPTLSLVLLCIEIS
jgi:hypothetical protein